MKFACLCALIFILTRGCLSYEDLAVSCDALEENRFWKLTYNMRPLLGHSKDYYSFTVYKNHLTPKINHPFLHAIMIFPTGFTSAFKKYEHDMIYNFYAGDTVMFYELDSTTGVMNVTKLGYKTRKYFKAVRKGNWRAIDIERYTNDRIAVFGMTMFVNKKDIGNRSHSRSYPADRKELLRHYPEYSEIITKFTRDPEKYS